MKERILKILEELNLSSTKLAEEIHVQRSSISHILSGRNKPSFDFIQKLLKRYPEINSRWLILGEGTLFHKKKQGSLPFDQPDNKENTELTQRETNIQDKTRPEDGISKTDEVIEHDKKTIKIKKIVIFYSDHSFEEYHPQDKE